MVEHGGGAGTLVTRRTDSGRKPVPKERSRRLAAFSTEREREIDWSADNADKAAPRVMSVGSVSGPFQLGCFVGICFMKAIGFGAVERLRLV
jgi:hypothetical protein